MNKSLTDYTCSTFSGKELMKHFVNGGRYYVSSKISDVNGNHEKINLRSEFLPFDEALDLYNSIEEIKETDNIQQINEFGFITSDGVFLDIMKNGIVDTRYIDNLITDSYDLSIRYTAVDMLSYTFKCLDHLDELKLEKLVESGELEYHRSCFFSDSDIVDQLDEGNFMFLAKLLIN